VPGELPEISVIVPVYGCADALVELHRRLTDTLVCAAATYELIFVEDRGSDDSWARLEAIAQKDPRTGIFRHTRNFGQHAAITAGLARARGRYVVVMDCDLQDPPELIPVLWQRAKDGIDVVFARQDEKVTSPARKILGNMYYRLLAWISGMHVDARQGTFSFVSRRAVDAVLECRDVDRNYVFLLRWLAFPTATVEYRRDKRHSGRSSYTLRKLIAHGFSGLIFQTTVLLRYVIYLGFLLAGLGIALALYIFIAKLDGSRAPGWTSLAIFTLTTGGFVIMSTGITGLYVGKILEQVRGRPLSVFDVERPSAVAGSEPGEAAAATAIGQVGAALHVRVSSGGSGAPDGLPDLR
jgi:glycosyltransferase involved in cell wall biosynthesis